MTKQGHCQTARDILVHKIRSNQHPTTKDALIICNGLEWNLDWRCDSYSNNSKPLLVMTRKGTDTSLPSLLLTSHMDVVPVTEVQMIIHH